MEMIAKRNSKVKKEEEESNEDSKGPNGSAEDLASTHSSAEPLHAPCSEDSSMGSQGDEDFKQEFQDSQDFKQESPALSDEEAEDSFLVDDTYQPATTQRPRNALDSLASKTKARRSQPYQRRPSKTQRRGASSDAHMPHHASPSPEFVTSSMAPHSPVYATHPTMGGPYTNSHIMSPMYTTNHDMDSFYASSLGHTYHGLPAAHAPSYQATHPDDFQF
jgi:hypothetical protein